SFLLKVTGNKGIDHVILNILRKTLPDNRSRSMPLAEAWNTRQFLILLDQLVGFADNLDRWDFDLNLSPGIAGGGDRRAGFSRTHDMPFRCKPDSFGRASLGIKRAEPQGSNLSVKTEGERRQTRTGVGTFRDGVGAPPRGAAEHHRSAVGS